MRRLIIISVLAFSNGSAAQGGDTATGAEGANLACSGGVRDTVSMGVTGQRLTVSTIIMPRPEQSAAGSPVTFGPPAYEHTITRQNGEILLRYRAEGLFSNAGPISCEDRLNAAQRQLVESLSDAERLEVSDTGIMSLPVRMSQLSACLINDDACNTEPHYVNPSADLRALGADAFDELLEEEPVTFSVFVSDCQRDTYLYEPRSGAVLNTESQGC
ncbi:MAG: hypothetical protein AAF292_01955 [Pseudomonadota bacterium]